VKKEFFLKRVRKSKIPFCCSFFFAAVLILLIGCTKKSINEETAVKIYVEKLIAEESYSFNADSILFHKQKVFSKYNTTEYEFNDYLKKLESDQEKWESFFKKSDEYLLELNKKGIVK